MTVRLTFTCALLLAAACSAQPQASQATPPQPSPPPPAAPVLDLPDDAPAATVANVPATTGRANLTPSAPPFAVTTMFKVNEPFALAFLPNGDLLVTEKAGKLKLRSARGAVSEVGGVPRVVNGSQGGLLDVEIAPDFATSRTIYLSYSEAGVGNGQLALARGTLEQGSTASLKNVQVIWRSGQAGAGGQFGANIVFAPDGKSLFLSSGERQRFTPAQDPAQALGKILHLTLDGKPAPGNPMAGQDDVRASTWSSGHRNPYGMVFTADGRLWEEEMGPRGGDELNLILPGRNYGWPIVSNGDNYSGQPIPDHPSRPDLEAPKAWWNPSISPGGMIAYSGAMFPQYRGNLLIGALSGEALIRVVLDGDKAKAVEQWKMGARIRDVAQAPDGAIWLLQDDGNVVRLTPRGGK